MQVKPFRLGLVNKNCRNNLIEITNMLGSNFLGHIIAEPVQQSQELMIYWPLPTVLEDYRIQPEEYVSMALGHEVCCW